MSSPRRQRLLARMTSFVLEAAAKLLSDPSAPDGPDDDAPKELASVDEQLLRALRSSQRS
jgi:hypothetical protein